MNYGMVFERMLELEHKRCLQDMEIAIYPYGVLGKLTRNVLVNEFSIKTIWCIDNHKTGGGEGIKFDDFINEKHTNILWIVATEKYAVFNELVVQLFEYGVSAKDFFILNKNMLLGYKALEKILNHDEYRTVLDVGCGEGIQGRILADYGKTVTGLTITQPCKCLENVIYENFLEFAPTEQYDVVFASHIMEHMADERDFVLRLKRCVKKDGCMAITVPAREKNIMFSHIHSYNAGRILRFLLMAGIDCSEAQILEYGYNLSIIIPRVREIVEKEDIQSSIKREVFKADNIFHYLPEGVKLISSYDGSVYFDGDITKMNWEISPCEFTL